MYVYIKVLKYNMLNLKHYNKYSVFYLFIFFILFIYLFLVSTAINKDLLKATHITSEKVLFSTEK